MNKSNGVRFLSLLVNKQRKPRNMHYCIFLGFHAFSLLVKHHLRFLLVQLQVQYFVLVRWKPFKVDSNTCALIEKSLCSINRAQVEEGRKEGRITQCFNITCETPSEVLLNSVNSPILCLSKVEAIQSGLQYLCFD